MGEILIVDDMEDMRISLANIVKKEGYRVITASTGQEAADSMRSKIIDLVFLDIGLPDGSGIDMIGKLKGIEADVDIVMLTGLNDAKTAVESLKAGAVDYIVKPFEIVEFKTILNRIMQSRTMAQKAMLENRDKGFDTIICSSKVMQQVKASIQSAAEVHVPVLITGETGTGKELVAGAIHHYQNQPKGVLVKVDCGTLSPSLIESELFGYEKGAFTDARTAQKGLVEIADGGTLFLDEIGNLPLALQPKLLRLIEESSFRRVGGLKDIQTKVRIVAATNTDLKKESECGNFRELRNLVEREVIFCKSGWISMAGLNMERSATATRKSQKNLPLREMEKLYISKVLTTVNNNKSQAARILGISRTTLREKLQTDQFSTD